MLTLTKMNCCRVSFSCCCGGRTASFGVWWDAATSTSWEARVMTAVLMVLFVTANTPQLTGAIAVDSSFLLSLLILVAQRVNANG